MTQTTMFTPQEIQKVAAVKVDYSKLEPECMKCGMYKGCKHPRCGHTGEGRLKALIIAEAMGSDEDKIGKQLVGVVGQFFRGKLNERELDLDRDFWKINACNCWPRDSSGNVRTPTKKEIQCCKPMVERTIRTLNPHFIILMGGSAIESFYSGRFKERGISRWRGLCIPDQKYKAWVMPLFHPSYPNRMEDPNLDSTYDRDLDQVIERLKEYKDKWPELDTSGVEILYDFQEIMEVLEEVKRSASVVYHDYETNTLKPQRPGAKIVSCSFAVSFDQAFSFPLGYRDYWTKSELKQIEEAWKGILRDERILKVVHNAKFEDNWSYWALDCDTRNWYWDTMIGAHVLDCRSYYTNLKFQSYLHFGVEPYGKHLDKFLRSKGDDYFNTVDEAPLKELLHYGALDSLFGFRLMEIQEKEFKKHKKLGEAYQFLFEGSIELGYMQCNGIPVDEEYYLMADKELEGDIEELTERLTKGEEAQKFRQRTGKLLDIKSPKDLGILFYEVLGQEPIYTGKANYSVDKNALARIKIPFVKDLLEMRKLEKIKGTYLAQFIREVCNGKMYPFFDLHLVITYRSSCSKPNFQNIPFRDETARYITRSGIIPSPGHQILEVDFKSIEVCVAAIYTKDPTLIAQVTDPSFDMHRDTAAEIWMLPQEEVTKDLRFYAKNGWVFPQFYGSYYENCAKNIWETSKDLPTTSGEPVKEHIRKKGGIRHLQEFIEHCKKVEDRFWNERFKVYKKWKEKAQKEFQKKGYVETYFGFRYTGYLTRNEVNNYPIQGTAFHILLYTLIHLNRTIVENQWLSKIMGQIHDSIVFDANPKELPLLLRYVNQIGTKWVREDHPWISVPLALDAELAPVGGNWAQKEPIDWREVV